MVMQRMAGSASNPCSGLFMALTQISPAPIHWQVRLGTDRYFRQQSAVVCQAVSVSRFAEDMTLTCISQAGQHLQLPYFLTRARAFPEKEWRGCMVNSFKSLKHVDTI